MRKRRVRKGEERKLILGLDVSLNGTGWAVVECVGGCPTALVACGDIKNNSNMTHGKRLRRIRNELILICSEYEINEIAKEKGFSRFHKDTQALFKAHGITDEFFADYNLKEYAATTIKKQVTGNGRATKAQVEKKVIEILKLGKDFKFLSDNVSDAAAVALTHIFKGGC